MMLILRIEYLDGKVSVLSNVVWINTVEPNKHLRYYAHDSREPKSIQTNWARVSARADNGFPLEEYVSEALLKKQTCRHGVHTTVKDYVMMCEDCDFIFGKFDPKNLLPSGVTPEECKHHITQTIGMSKICYNCSAVVKRLDNQVNA